MLERDVMKGRIRDEEEQNGRKIGSDDLACSSL